MCWRAAQLFLTGWRLRPHYSDWQRPAWLRRQVLAAGGEMEANAVRVDGYQVLRPPRGKSAREMHIGVLDFEGTLTLLQPAAFLERLSGGFGRAKAFGCGLMLIRRA